jgi:hypothetical protein
MTDLLDQETARNGQRRRRRWPWLVGALLACGVVFVLVWFQPQKLFIQDRVDEAIPTGGAGDTDGRSSTPAVDDSAGAASSGPVEIAQGEFVSLDHSTSGVVRVLELGAGHRVVRLEGFETDNGPDLYLYLTASRAGDDESAFDDDFVNLGRLKGNKGDQNYDLPADIDLARFATVVIWCDRFNSAFGAADLTT